MYTVLIESIGGMPPPQMFEEKIDTNITLLHIQETYQDYNDNSNEEITDTSLKEYLTKVDKIPKLTKEEEINLLEKIAKGDEASLKQFEFPFCDHFIVIITTNFRCEFTNCFRHNQP